MDVEVYVRKNSESGLLSILSRATGPLSRVDGDFGSARVYCGRCVSLVISDCVDGFMGVWLKGEIPWSSAPAFGRFLSREMSCEVRCDPGVEYVGVSPQSDTFLKILDGSETLVEWS